MAENTLDGWTTQTLKEYIEALLEASNHRYAERYEASQVALQAALLAQEKAVNTALLAAKEAVGAALTAAKEAVQKAEIASEKRFDNVNEFRETLADQQRTLMPRAEAEVLIKNLTTDIASLRESRSEAGGRRLGSAEIIAYLLLALAIAGFLSGHIH